MNDNRLETTHIDIPQIPANTLAGHGDRGNRGDHSESATIPILRRAHGPGHLHWQLGARGGPTDLRHRVVGGVPTRDRKHIREHSQHAVAIGRGSRSRDRGIDQRGGELQRQGPFGHGAIGIESLADPPTQLVGQFGIGASRGGRRDVGDEVGGGASGRRGTGASTIFSFGERFNIIAMGFDSGLPPTTRSIVFCRLGFGLRFLRNGHTQRYVSAIEPLRTGAACSPVPTLPR
ncbi:hypothetical protein [Nocardia sp. NPDC004415]